MRTIVADEAMIDRETMRLLVDEMERAAEETLQHDSTFYETVQALKSEIDNDPVVRSMVSKLQTAGRSVFNSFVPRIRIRVRTEKGVFALPRRDGIRQTPTLEPSGGLVQELRNAASTVIKKSRYYNQLDHIVNGAIESSDRFEGIAARVEDAGYEVLICLDLSAYAQVHTPSQERQAPHVNAAESAVDIRLTAGDRKFLAALKISIDPS